MRTRHSVLACSFSFFFFFFFSFSFFFFFFFSFFSFFFSFIVLGVQGKVDLRGALTLLSQLREYMAALNTTAPVVIHCSAGVGRTGALIAIDAGMDAFNNNHFVDVLAFTQQMRQDRMAMLRYAAQYRFACYAVAMYVRMHLRERQSLSIKKIKYYGAK